MNKFSTITELKNVIPENYTLLRTNGPDGETKVAVTII